MLYSQNLISKPGKDSYNAQVRNINIMQNKEAGELKLKYEEQNGRYTELNEVKENVRKSVDELNQAIECLDSLILLFKSAARI